MAFSNALLGIVHSMAHKTGAAFSTGHIPHGCANAIYLPYVIKYNAKDPVAAKRYAEIARRMGLPGTSEKALINSLVAKIDAFNVELGIPKTLKEFGINEEEFKEKHFQYRRTCSRRCMYRIQPEKHHTCRDGKTSHMYILRNRSRLLNTV